MPKPALTQPKQSRRSSCRVFFPGCVSCAAAPFQPKKQIPSPTCVPGIHQLLLTFFLWKLLCNRVLPQLLCTARVLHYWHTPLHGPVQSSRGTTFSTTRRAPPCGLVPLHGTVHKFSFPCMGLCINLVSPHGAVHKFSFPCTGLCIKNVPQPPILRDCGTFYALVSILQEQIWNKLYYFTYLYEQLANS